MKILLYFTLLRYFFQVKQNPPQKGVGNAYNYSKINYDLERVETAEGHDNSL